MNMLIVGCLDLEMKCGLAENTVLCFKMLK